MSSSSQQVSSQQQVYRTWIKKQQVPLGCSILQVFVKENDIIEINQPLFEYKVYNVNHNGIVGDRVGVFLASIYKNLNNNTLCKAKIKKILLISNNNINNNNNNNINNNNNNNLDSSLDSLIVSQSNPYHITNENQRIILHIEYIDESVKESITNSDFEPQTPTYTLL